MALPFPLDGSTLIVGPSNVGKTRLTAQALDAWVADHGATGCVVLDFAPTIQRDGETLGGPLTQFTAIPESAFHGAFDAHAPRSASETDAEALALAETNADAALKHLGAAPPDPTAVFVNDATIALQGPNEVTERLRTYCDRAKVAVLNAFESQELGVDDPVSKNELAAIDALRAWADRTVELS